MADQFSFQKDRYVLIGKVTKAHGIKGELKVRAYSDQVTSITRLQHLFLVSAQGLLSPRYLVARARAGNKEAIVQLVGVSDRNLAERLCGMGVLIEKKDLPELEGAGFYLHELEGLEVVTESGRSVGIVSAFFNNGVHDLLVVDSGENEIMIPLIPGMITARDKKYLTISLHQDCWR